MYAVHLEIAPKTTQAAPKILALEIAPGIVKKVTIIHPTGCADLVGVWINYLSSRLYPANDSGVFLGNGNPITFSPNTPVLEPPHFLEVCGYNEDDTYTHSPTIYIEIEGEGSFAARQSRLTNLFTAQLLIVPSE